MGILARYLFHVRGIARCGQLPPQETSIHDLPRRLLQSWALILPKTKLTPLLTPLLSSMLTSLVIPLVVLVIYPGWANADQAEFDIVAPPACLNNKGEAVVFRDVKNQGPQSAAGMANRDENGVPVVYRFNYHTSPQALQRFIDLHECAHHQTGDVDLPHPPRNSQAHLMNESIADCIAALRIRDEFDDGQDIMAAASAELRSAMQAIGFPDITVESRISNITNCFQKAETATAFTDGVLEHRGLK